MTEHLLWKLHIWLASMLYLHLTILCNQVSFSWNSSEVFSLCWYVLIPANHRAMRSMEEGKEVDFLFVILFRIYIILDLREEKPTKQQGLKNSKTMECPCCDFSCVFKAFHFHTDHMETQYQKQKEEPSDRKTASFALTEIQLLLSRPYQNVVSWNCICSSSATAHSFQESDLCWPLWFLHHGSGSTDRSYACSEPAAAFLQPHAGSIPGSQSKSSTAVMVLRAVPQGRGILLSLLGLTKGRPA